MPDDREDPTHLSRRTNAQVHPAAASQILLHDLGVASLCFVALCGKVERVAQSLYDGGLPCSASAYNGVEVFREAHLDPVEKAALPGDRFNAFVLACLVVFDEANARRWVQEGLP